MGHFQATVDVSNFGFQMQKSVHVSAWDTGSELRILYLPGWLKYVWDENWISGLCYRERII